MKTVLRVSRTTFAALAVPNYRRYYGGQSISLIGTWMQMTAQAWLVLRLSHSAAVLGIVIALQTLPVMLIGPYAGVIADRSNKHKLMIALQSAMGVQALLLGLLTLSGSAHVWEVGVLAAVLGVNQAFENPIRQSFMTELVGAEHLRNAVSLNSVLFNLARSVGPAIAGVLIATTGESVCFLVNAASFIAVVWSLASMDLTQLQPANRPKRAAGQLREGLHYVASTRDLWVPLTMMAAVGCLTYEFQVTLPYMASRGLHAGASGFGFMTAALGVGAVVGGLFVAARGKTGTRRLVVAAAGFGLTLVVAALAGSLPIELCALVIAGGASVSFMATGNATLQLRSAPEMRGRVMSLWFVAFQGSTPIGGPLIGLVMSALGPRAGLGLGAATCLVVAALGALTFVSRPQRIVLGEPAHADSRK